MPNFRNRPQRSASRPNRSWDGFFTTALVNVPAASKVLLGSFTLNNPGIDETLLRTVGTLFVATDALSNESQIGAVGLIPITEIALAAGVASIPGPVSDIGSDGWAFHQTFCQDWSFATAVGQTMGGLSYSFDSRGKRVVSDQHALALVVENAHATQAFDFYIAMRILSQVRGTR